MLFFFILREHHFVESKFNNNNNQSISKFKGIIYGAFALGPALGYITASILLSKWLYLNETPPIDEKDPRWVGCWYPGLLIVAGIVFLFSSLLMSFPEHLKEERRREIQAKRVVKRKEKLTARQERLNQMAQNRNGGAANKEDPNSAMGDFKKAQANKLETIDEAAEISAEIDKSFEFLDSEHGGGDSNTSMTNESESEPSIIFTGR